jgi:HSP20 family protein
MSLLTRRERGKMDPFRELRELSQRMDRLFALEPFYSMSGDGAGIALTDFDWSPSVNISETDKNYLIKADLPEVKKEDVKVGCADGELTIEGERKQQKTDQNERFHRTESSYGRFMRRFTLPSDADENSIDANYKDGTLTISINKTPGKQSKARQIKVS